MLSVAVRFVLSDEYGYIDYLDFGQPWRIE